MKTGPEPPILYSFRRCPYAMRARMALASSGIECELREIILRNKPAHMLVLSPKGTVPVLWLTNGRVLDESLEVMQWALGQNDPEALTAYAAGEHESAAELIELNDGPFKHNLDRYKYASRYENADALEHRTACSAFVERLNGVLDGRPWLFGDKPKLVDLALLPFLRQFRIADPDWFDDQTQWPHVQAWVQAFLQSNRLAKVMRKYPIWQDGDVPVTFP
ncbi:MAG: glutathione S-transferase [Parvibaculales bacterium]